MTVRQRLAVGAVGLVAALAATAFVLRYAPWPMRGRHDAREAIATLPPVTIVLPESGTVSRVASHQGRHHALTGGGALPDSIRIQIGGILRVPTMGIAPEPVPLPDSPHAFARGADSARFFRRTAFGTPTVEAPRVTNRAEAARVLRQIYPAELLGAPVAGITVLRMRITEDGEVQRRFVTATSGNMLLDRAALAAMKSLHFSPARYAGQPVGADVEIPVVFRVRPGS